MVYENSLSASVTHSVPSVFRRVAHDQIATTQDRREIWDEIIDMLGTVQ